MLNISVFHILLYSYYVPFYSRTFIISIIMLMLLLLFLMGVCYSQLSSQVQKDIIECVDMVGPWFAKKNKKHIFVVPMKVMFCFRCFPEIFSCFPIVFVCVPGFSTSFFEPTFLCSRFSHIFLFPCVFPIVFTAWFTFPLVFPVFHNRARALMGRQGTPRRSMAGATDAEGRWLVGVFHDVVLQNFGSTAGTGW